MADSSAFQSSNIIKDLRKGNASAYQELFRIYGKTIYNISRNFQLDHDESEEVVQETIIIIWERRTFLDEGRNFDGYIRTIARNQILRILRRNALKKAETYLREAEPILVPEVESHLNYEVIQETVDLAVAKLSPQSKRIFELSRNEGFSHAEIADCLNISQRTVENQIYRVLQKLKLALNRQELMFFVLSSFCF
jgi:RNA polymerase sigma-70 factor (ECF subfamily)